MHDERVIALSLGRFVAASQHVEECLVNIEYYEIINCIAFNVNREPRINLQFYQSLDLFMNIVILTLG